MLHFYGENYNKIEKEVSDANSTAHVKRKHKKRRDKIREERQLSIANAMKSTMELHKEGKLLSIFGENFLKRQLDKFDLEVRKEAGAIHVPFGGIPSNVMVRESQSRETCTSVEQIFNYSNCA